MKTKNSLSQQIAVGIGFVAILLAAAMAQAGQVAPIHYEGRVCILGADFTIDEVFSTVAKEAADTLKSQCEQAPGVTGGVSEFLSVEIKNPQKRCPYGHQFQYVLEGQCNLP